MRSAVVEPRKPVTLAPRGRPAMSVHADDPNSVAGGVYVELEMLHLELELVKSLLRQGLTAPKNRASRLGSGPASPLGSEYWIG